MSDASSRLAVRSDQTEDFEIRASRRSAAHQRWRACRRIAFGFLLFFALDAAIFRSGLYLPWIAPDSGLGWMEIVLRAIDSIPAGQRSVLVLGDSRIGEGFSAKLATGFAKSVGSPVIFTSGGVPGTLPRDWYYMLRQIDGPAERLAAVAIMMPSYHDNDNDPQADRPDDIAFLHPLLGFSDMLDFPASFLTRSKQIEAAEAILFAGLFYKNDVQDLLADPLDRIRKADASHEHGLEWYNDYPGQETSLVGLRFDMDSGKLIIAPDHQPPRPDMLADYAANLRLNQGRLPDNELAVEYRRKWIGRMAEFCRHAGIKLIVFRIPRGPLHHMVDADEPPTGTLAALARAGMVELLPASTFDELEQPQFFFDQLHLNRVGREAFSVALARAVLAALQASR